MAVDFSKFDNMVDETELQKQVAEAKVNEYEDVPNGTYICSIEKMEVKPTKAGDKLMFSVGLKIKETVESVKEQKGRWIFFNRIICGNKPKVKNGISTWNDGVAIKGVMTWLEKLDSGYDIEFQTYSQFNELVLDIFQDITNQVEIEVKYDASAFNPVTIKDVYDVQ